MKNKITILYIPCPDVRLAKKIGLKLLTEKLAACVQTFPVSSAYPWNGKIENANEIALIVKTISKKVAKAKSIIRKNHSYEIPCIIQSTASVNKEYYNWMKKEMD